MLSLGGLPMPCYFVVSGHTASRLSLAVSTEKDKADLMLEAVLNIPALSKREHFTEESIWQ